MENTKDLLKELTSEDEKKYINEQKIKELTDVRDRAHFAKLKMNTFIRQLTLANIPSFVAVYIPGKGYQYNAVFPEELEMNDCDSECGKFNEFLKTCINFNKENYLPHIQDNE